MKKVLLSTLIIASLTACSTSTEKTEAAVESKPLPELAQVDITPNRVMTMQIDGMVCQMGCGGSIRKELKGTEAVANCEFDFEDGRETNTATISFDKEKISADEIIKIVSEMNEKQFTVGDVSTTVLENIPGHEDIATPETTNDDKDASTSVEISSTTGIQLPNLFDLLSELVVH